MLCFEKLVDLGSAAPHVYVMYQEYLRSVDCIDYVIAYKVLLASSHICFHQKSTTLAYVIEVTVIHFPYAQITYVNPLLSLGGYFVFL